MGLTANGILIMGPFIPQGIINPDLSLFFALLLGLGFGYVLEQAGFSSARKLAGVFYGYDFVVLKVFFTAGITAMVGLMFFSYLGWVDMGLLYIQPTFLYSAILGGVIMGFGFILGGFCPGTSIVGAVIGKADAMVFILGIFLGMFVFGHFYHVFEPVYTGHFLGHLYAYDALGISRDWFGLVMVLMAIAAFVITQMIEDRVNKAGPEITGQRPNYMVPAFLIIAAAFIFVLLPSERKSHLADAPPSILIEEVLNKQAYVSAQRIIHQIRNQRSELILIDTRPEAEYRRFTLPGAIHLTVKQIPERQWRGFFNDNSKPKVFFGNGSSGAMEAWMIARRAGYRNVHIMEGGLNHLFGLLFGEPTDSAFESQDMVERLDDRFLREARHYFLEGGASEKAAIPKPHIRAPEAREVIPVIGGC